MKKIAIILLFIITSCTSSAQDKTKFSEKALADVMLTLEGDEKTFAEIINQYKGKKVVIDVWASWCGDCVRGMPKVKEFQKEYTKDIVYLFLSLDKNTTSWKRGIKRYGVEGEHYFITSGWDGEFCKSIDLDWIPRYMVVDKTGKIKFWKAKKATSRKLEKAIAEE